MGSRSNPISFYNSDHSNFFMRHQVLIMKEDVDYGCGISELQISIFVNSELLFQEFGYSCDLKINTYNEIIITFLDCTFMFREATAEAKVTDNQKVDRSLLQIGFESFSA